MNNGWCSDDNIISTSIREMPMPDADLIARNKQQITNFILTRVGNA